MSKAQYAGRVIERCAPLDAAHSPAHSFMPAFLRLRDVLRITSLSRATIYRRIAARRFPPPVHLGGRACGWSAAALQDWINDPQGYCAPTAEDPRAVRKRGRPHSGGADKGT